MIKDRLKRAGELAQNDSSVPPAEDENGRGNPKGNYVHARHQEI
jgi:hypothetical protein